MCDRQSGRTIKRPAVWLVGLKLPGDRTYWPRGRGVDHSHPPERDGLLGYPWAKLLRRMFRVYVKLCHCCATVIRGGVDLAARKAAKSHAGVQTLINAACKYGVDCGIAWHGYIARMPRAEQQRITRAHVRWRRHRYFGCSRHVLGW